MSLSFPTSPVYHTSAEQKRRSQLAAKKRGTPKILRDLLREKCRIRMKEARQNSFENTRNPVTLNDKFSINEVLRQEVAELEKDLELQEQIYEELKVEANNWFAEQLEEEENYLIEGSEIDEQVVCPVCQKFILSIKLNSNIYECSCGISFHYSGNSSSLRSALKSKVSDHEQNCCQKLLFFVEPFQYATSSTPNSENKYVLSAMCDSCEFFSSF